MRSTTGNDERKTRLEGADIAAESLDRPFISLGNPLNRNPDKNEREQDDEEHEDGEGAEHAPFHSSSFLC